MSLMPRALIVLATLALVVFVFVGCDSGTPQPSPTPVVAPTTPAAVPTAVPAAATGPSPTPKPTAVPATTTEPSPTPKPTATVAPLPTSTPAPEAALAPEPVTGPTPPVAGERAYSSTFHGITVDDPWHWLEDEDYPTVDDEEVLAYLGRRRTSTSMPAWLPTRH